MPFLTLPPEVHHRIISHLLSNRDVANFSIQCRTLHALCDMETRKKYNRIHITGRDEGIDRAFNLLMDIIRRPSLGYFVRQIDHWQPLRGPEEYKEGVFERELSDEDMRLLASAVRKAGFVDRNERRVINMLMQKKQHKGHLRWDNRCAFITQAIAAVLVALSPHLVSIAMTQPFYNYFGYYMTDWPWAEADHVDFPLDKLFRDANANPVGKPYLQNLRKVYIINKQDLDDERYYQEMDFIGCFPIFDRLPSIEWVGTDVLEDDRDNGMPDLVQGPCNITRVSITHSFVGSTYLAKVISPCAILKEFRFTMGGRADRGRGYNTFNPKAIIKALCPHKQTLEILDIDIEEHVYPFYLVDDDEEPDWGGSPDEEEGEDAEFLSSFWENSGSLKEFTALKELRLAIDFLVYFARGTERGGDMVVDSLPDSLEELTILGYQKGENEGFDAQIDKLRDVMASGACSLKEVRGIDEMIPIVEGVGDPDEEADLVWDFKEVGYQSD
ncbi:hypothetical protein ASPWEDRAFT_183991 [Aspergillus wentii DTO 134E9]|uniref:F-box domain-containing protein n=1 Tax=Aspergillus wentii DTO 134E9 TaxID=1073089 RepID=A0A1L9RMH1_ASPWE|nr:uncharacterized protein ASPWEDRAFT_183991 [Aspergillus wentii DTO 134E9]KAI9929540.1 hypothetical protein MW887_001013 [Aspergillus wentii]OJJ36018.1 hypothetical protein ASPWEDRAFT_183991 [Aspergillus wentii DTO 134E9]